MTKIKGYAVGMESLPADHTYVKGGNKSWPCWGRDYDGTEICSGDGSITEADCISQPNSQAGIKYAVTGVCHQTANRILWPTDNHAVVSAARGYWASCLIYGVYGKDIDAWNKRKANCAGKTKSAKRKSAENYSEEQAYLAQIDELHEKLLSDNQRFDSTNLLVEEFKILWDFKIGKQSRSKDVFSDLSNALNDVLEDIKEIIALYEEGKLKISAFAERVNNLLNDLLDNFSKLLSKDEYFNLFDLVPGEKTAIVDPKSFVDF